MFIKHKHLHFYSCQWILEGVVMQIEPCPVFFLGERTRYQGPNWEDKVIRKVSDINVPRIGVASCLNNWACLIKFPGISPCNLFLTLFLWSIPYQKRHTTMTFNTATKTAQTGAWTIKSIFTCWNCCFFLLLAIFQAQ